MVFIISQHSALSVARPVQGIHWRDRPEVRHIGGRLFAEILWFAYHQVVVDRDLQLSG
jgi:hypothetical protein